MSAPVLKSSSASASTTTRPLTRGHSCRVCARRKVRCDGQRPCATCVRTHADCVDGSGAAAGDGAGRRQTRAPATSKGNGTRNEKGNAGAKVVAKDGASASEENEEAMPSVLDPRGGAGVHKKGRECERTRLLRAAKELLMMYAVGMRREVDADGDSIDGAPSVVAESASSTDGRGSPPAPTKEHVTTRSISVDHDGRRLIAEGRHARYIENPIWDGLSKEMPESPRHSSRHQPKGNPSFNFASSFGSEHMVFGQPTPYNLSMMHPDPLRIFRLWQICIDNVNPLVKILHVPTIQQSVLEASADLTAISPDMEALMFAIYLSAIASLSEKECQKVMGESSDALIERYTALTQQALTNARFMQSLNLATLQAFLLFVLSVRQRTDHQSLWMLTGLAIRSSQRMGLHREKALEGFSIFEAEMRRRLWWQILVLDSYASKLCGVAFHTGPNFFWDTELPMNLNDADLHLNMSEPPKEHVGATEMIFCGVKLTVGAFTIMHTDRLRDSKNVAVAEDELDRLSEHLEDKFLKFCNSSIPVHYCASMLARAAVCHLRLAARLPRRYASSTTGMPTHDRIQTFALCLELLEAHNLGTTNDKIQHFAWFHSAFFPFEPFIFLLGEMAYHDAIPESLVEGALFHVEMAYELKPRLLQDRMNALQKALGQLTLKAWEKTSRTRMSHTETQSATPRFIQRLYARQQDSVHEISGAEHSLPKSDLSDECLATRAQAANHIHHEQHNWDMTIAAQESGSGVEDSSTWWLYWPELFAANDASSFDDLDFKFPNE